MSGRPPLKPAPAAPLLEELQRVTEAERRALITGDWRALAGCVERKHELAAALAQLPAAERAATQQLQRLSAATRYNQTLAATLSQQLGEVLAAQGDRPTYGPRGRRVGRPESLVSLRG